MFYLLNICVLATSDFTNTVQHYRQDLEEMETQADEDWIHKITVG